MEEAYDWTVSNERKSIKKISFSSSVSPSSNNSFVGAFHNPEFHRDITRAKLVRIMRRGPPARTSKMSFTKNRPSTRTELADALSDDEWKPGNKTIAALNRFSFKGRSSRVTKKGAKKSVRKIWKASDNDGVEGSSSHGSRTKFAHQSSLKTRPSSTAINNRFLEIALALKIPNNETHVHVEEACKVKSHAPSKLLSPNRRYGATPRTLSANLLCCEADDSPTKYWSPFFGGLMRQESVAAIKSVGFCPEENKTSHKGGEHNLARNPGENFWPQWNETHTAGSADVARVPRAEHSRSSVPHTRDISPFLSTNSGLVSILRECPNISAQATQDIAPNSSVGEALSPLGVCPVSFIPSMSRSLVTGPPLLSRENSAAFPIALAQRVSSSFFLPFMGMTDTLSYALELQPESVPSTPTPAGTSWSSFQQY